METHSTFRIIVIDDNQSIHHDFIKILRTEPTHSLDQLSTELFGVTTKDASLPVFEIDVASQGQEGVARIKDALAQGKHYALAFVDIRMPPGWDGIETIKHIWEVDKDIQVVICTAFSDYSWEETVANLGKTDNLLILKKPFDNISVRQLACALTTKWKLAEEARKYMSNLQQLVADRTLSLEKSLSLLKSTFESSSDGILVLDNAGRIIDYNQKIIYLLEIPESILKAEHHASFLAHLQNEIEKPEDFLTLFKDFHKDNTLISINTIKLKNGKIFECYSQPHTLNDNIIGRILDFRDITKRAELEQELHFQATHDSLTQLGNRLTLLEGMRNAIQVAEQTQTSFAVIFIDFDRFKLVNDSLSHQVGDELLKLAALRLKKIIGSHDTLARLGGDEFVILFTDTDTATVENKVYQLLTLFQEPYDLAERQILLTASIGVSVYPGDGTQVDDLLRKADTAMYQAKYLKGNTFQFYHPDMSTQSMAELEMEMELHNALANDEFFLYYQPQFDITTEKLVALEALIRWQHPTKGILLPIDFIPMSEKVGLIVPIGEWVMRTACVQNKAWQDAGLQKIRVAVNVASEQFDQQNFVNTVKKIVTETGLEPKYLEIELTENVILSRQDIVEAVNDLKALGVGIAIDDFGTGYSVLSYLPKLPLDRLKIDRSFLNNIQNTSDNEVILRAVITMAKNLNLGVLAEGVETTEQLDFLRKNQCGDAQGYYFSKPLPADEIKAYLKGTPEIHRMITPNKGG